MIPATLRPPFHRLLYRSGAIRETGAALIALFFTSAASGASWTPQPVPGTPAIDGSPLYYRCFIRVPDNMTSRAAVDLWTDSAMISFVDIPGPFTVLLNGQKIAEGDSLPPEARRRFKIPKGILEKKAFNVLALRVEGGAARSGLKLSPVLHGYHDELLLEGTWEIYSGEPPAAEFRSVTDQPAGAVFTEANFHEASTPLAPNAELVRGERLPPDESLAKIHTPADLAIDLMLHEPQVAQPTHFNFDARGRLWVAQYRQYPYPAGLKMVSRDKYYRSTFDRVPPAPPNHTRGRDVVSVHEDTDGDGTLDRHREVLTGLNMANAVLHGHGGIWVMHTPYLLFYPDRDGDDVPDGDPEVRLAGFGLEDTHSIANGLAWGPDGWIYGAQGSTTTSHIRRPGIDAPDAPGMYYESCMVWRYHPDTFAYEIFAEGGGNNFGLEFDAEGRVYSGHNGGETRGWHYVQNGIYLKQGKDPGKFGPPINPYSFGELSMMSTTNKITRFSHHFAIAEGTALPTNYLGLLFNADPLHHNVVISDRTRIGSTFTTADRGFALESDDLSVRPVFIANAPDGAMYVADFYEQYIAHGQNYQGQIDPDSGRIYRLRGKSSMLNKDVNLARKSTSELLATLSHSNKWHRQTAVRLLGERRDPAAREPLLKLLMPDKSTRSTDHPALEALWILHQAKWLDDQIALTTVQHPVATVRAWTIRLLGDRKYLPAPFAEAVTRLAATESEAEVRCHIASTARRLPAAQALPLVAALLRRDADSNDPFIPLLCWWTIEGFCETDRPAVLSLFRRGVGRSSDMDALWRSTIAREHILPRLMRRFASKGTRADFVACAELLNAAPTAEDRNLLVAAFEKAFQGRAVPPLPDELAAALARLGKEPLLLRVRRGDANAVQEALTLIGDPKAKREERLAHIRAFGQVPQPAAVAPLLALAKRDGDVEARKAALASLSRYDDTSIGSEIAKAYNTLPLGLRPAAQNLLISRAAWSLSFLKLIETGEVKPDDVPADNIARLRNHTDQSVSELMARVFPQPKPVLHVERRATIERIQSIVKAGAGNPYAGESIFTERCASCHQLFHKGGQIGPNLTTYQRDDLGTLLPSILDPSAEIREGYLNYLIETKDGRSLSGFVADQDPNVIVLRGVDGENVPLARTDVVEMKPAGMSLMPEGLIDDLNEQQLRDFFAYLRIPQPISK
jgi:putative membrane-bound dehydrogenase-like protein